MEYRIFVGWNKGAYVNSLDPDFHKDLNELIAQYGKPDQIELRNDNDWLRERCDKDDLSS